LDKLKADVHMAICGTAAVLFAPGAPGRAGAQCTHAAGAVDGSTADCPRVKFSLQRSLRPSRIFSTFPLKPSGSMKRACGNRGWIAVWRYVLKRLFRQCAWFTIVNAWIGVRESIVPPIYRSTVG